MSPWVKLSRFLEDTLDGLTMTYKAMATVLLENMYKLITCFLSVINIIYHAII